MDILSFEHGVLYFKLHEDWNKDTMHISCAIARIGRDGLRVNKGDSKIPVSSSEMKLSRQELKLIVEGYEMVRCFWQEAPLPKRHVLLSCGCIHPWDDLEVSETCIWCPDHEEVKCIRHNTEDFPEAPGKDIAHV